MGRPNVATDSQFIFMLEGGAASDPTGNVILDAGLAIRWINKAAVGVLGSSKVLFIRDNRLTATEPDVIHSLNEAVRMASAIPATRLLSAFDESIVCQIRLFQAGDQRSTLYAMRCRRAADSLRGKLGNFEHSFGLTRTEIEVFRHLIDGKRPKLIAEQMGISIDAVRTHVKRLYAKLGVNRKDEFLFADHPVSLFLGCRNRPSSG